MWLKGHLCIVGNEAADHMAGRARWIGKILARRDIVTLAGIRQSSPIHSKPAHLGWDALSIRGLTYMVTDWGDISDGKG